VERRDRLGEPAQRARAQPAEDDAAPPRGGQHLVEAVRAPGAQEADDAAAADVDEVLGEQVLGGIDAEPAVAAVAPEEREVARLTAPRGERAVEAHDVVVGVARGGRHEADARPLGAGDRQGVVVEQRVAGLHGEAPTAERDDLRRTRHARQRKRPSPRRRGFRARGRARLDHRSWAR
jgi:hypothetical protein